MKKSEPENPKREKLQIQHKCNFKSLVSMKIFDKSTLIYFLLSILRKYTFYLKIFIKQTYQTNRNKINQCWFIEYFHWYQGFEIAFVLNLKLFSFRIFWFWFFHMTFLVHILRTVVTFSASSRSLFMRNYS